MQTDIVIFVEDPGAANFVAGLPGALARQGLRTGIWTSGKAAAQLVALGERFEPYSDAPGMPSLLDERQPRLLVVGTSENPDSPAFRLIDQARRSGVVSVGLVDGPSNADHRFRGRTGDPLGHAPDWIVVADEAVRARFTALGMAGEQVIVGGHPRYDAVLERGRLLAAADRGNLRRRHFPGLAAGDKAVVFLSELSDGVNPHLYHRFPDYTLAGRGDVDGRTEIVLEEVLDALAPIRPRPWLTLRLHPKSTRGEFARWEGEIDGFSAGGGSQDLLEMLYAADLVVGLTTILMMEAALAGCRTLSVVPRPQESAWLPAVALGLTPCVSDRAALQRALRSALAGEVLATRRPADAVMPGALERVAGILGRLAGRDGHAAGGLGR